MSTYRFATMKYFYDILRASCFDDDDVIQRATSCFDDDDVVARCISSQKIRKLEVRKLDTS